MTKPDSANAVIAHIAQQTNKCLLFCSLGKDSLVLLDLIYPHFKHIVCVFMYFVKDLEHIDMYIRYICKRYPNILFVQIPHWNLTYILRGGLYCVPNPDVKLLKLADIIKAMRLTYKIDFCFLGMKKADSMNRRLMLNAYAQNFYENKGLVYPLAEWTQRDILAYMRQHHLPQPVRYSKNASNGCGFNIDCFLWLRQHFPQDLQKIYDAFPLSQRILYEYDQQHNNSATCPN